MKIQINSFVGMIPKINEKLLPDNAASYCVNCDFRFGNITPIKDTTEVEALTSAGVNPTWTVKTIFKIGATWISFDDDIIASCVPAFIADSDRFFYTGDGYPKQSTETDYPTTISRLGMVYPTVAPTTALTGSAGPGIQKVVRYVYTRVVKWADGSEEESAPSPDTGDITVYDGQGVIVSALVAGSGNNVTHFRVYRLEAGVTGSEYLFLAEFVVSTTSYTDHDGTSLNETTNTTLKTEDWIPPPDGLSGLAQGNNGMLAGFVGNKVYICEPYVAYAWPLKYTRTVGADVVAIRAYGDSFIILTEEFAVPLTGTSPDSMDLGDETAFQQSCYNGRSAVVSDIGVVWASPDGLCIHDGEQGAVITEDIIGREQWQGYATADTIGFYYNQIYYSFSEGSSTGFLLNFKKNQYLSLISITGNVWGGAIDPSTDQLHLIIER
jgi:hypothetical protein